MDSYEVIVAPKALEQLERYIDYIQYTLMNVQAAEAVWRDAVETRNKLAQVAGRLRLCGHPVLCERGYRMIPFARHRYVMLYRLEGNTAFVDGIYHQLQDYENLFI